MDVKGKLLFTSKTDTLKNGVVFIITGILLLFASNFIYAKATLIFFSLICIVIGIYWLFVKKNERVIIYENAIVISSKVKNQTINKKQIKSISYKELKSIRSPVVSYYPVLILNDNSEKLINIAFNSGINKKL